ncbi:MAG: sugar phosphate isomerase/epimerase [Candidatus Heimdallarchaeota archaeon]|nr:sugar phosphate isomerase/epimerase [Candidatus Heimdallarchaeota archaeon]
MGLLIGNNPFKFEDFFEMVMTGEADFSDQSYLKVMKKTLEAGFTHIEINGDLPYTLPGMLEDAEIDQLLEIKKKEKITYSVHLPLWGLEPSAFSPHVRNGAIDAFVDCIKRTKKLDPYCYVIHPTGPLAVEFLGLSLPDFAKDLVGKQFTQNAKDSLEKLLERIDLPPRKLAVENIEFPFELMEPIIEELDLSICFDTGHLLAGYSGKIGILDFVEKYYHRIIELHLHDGAYPRKDHKPLGTLELPVKGLLTTLNNKGFKGPLVFELGINEAKQSLEYIKEHCPEVL